MRERILRVVTQVVEQTDPELGDKTEGRIGPETPLYGKGSDLDSLGLVSLIVEIEQAIEDECGTSVVLADERAVSQTRSPFRTIGSLVDYVVGLLDKAEN